MKQIWAVEQEEITLTLAQWIHCDPFLSQQTHKKASVSHTFTSTHISLAGESTITVTVGHYALFPQWWM